MNAHRAIERQLAAAQEITHIDSWEWMLGDETVIWSDELYRIYGLVPQAREITFEVFLSLLHRDDRARVKERVGRAIELYANVFENAAGPVGRARSAVAAVDKLADFMRRMARDVERLHRRDPGEPGRTDVRRAVATAIRYGNTGANVPIAVRVHRDLTAAIAEHTLVRVLLNLIRNAAAAYPSPRLRLGWIVITATAGEGNLVAIEVSDTGAGIPEPVRERPFQAFVGGAGLRLGLAVGRALLRAAGGDLELVETSPSGTRFKVTVPAA